MNIDATTSGTQPKVQEKAKHFLVQIKIGIGPMCNLAHIIARTNGAPTKPFRKTFSTFASSVCNCFCSPSSTLNDSHSFTN